MIPCEKLGPVWFHLIIHYVAVTFVSKDFNEGICVNIDLGENLKRKHYRAKLFAVLIYDCYYAN